MASMMEFSLTEKNNLCKALFGDNSYCMYTFLQAYVPWISLQMDNRCERSQYGSLDFLIEEHTIKTL